MAEVRQDGIPQITTPNLREPAKGWAPALTPAVSQEQGSGLENMGEDPVERSGEQHRDRQR